MSRSLTSISSRPKCVEDLDEDHRAGDDHRRALRLERRHLAPLGERQRGEPLELRARAVEREPVPVHALAVVRVEPEVERGERRHRSRDADRLLRRRRATRSASSARTARAHCVELAARRRVGVDEPLGVAHGADVEAHVEVVDDQLGRAAADVERRASRAAAATPRRVSSASSSPLTSRVAKP